MATYTPNLSLYMPDSTDDFGEFREKHNDNMVKIDDAIGGGGGSGGHTIVNPSGTDMPTESKLQFTGNVSVTDDSGNGKTVVDILGGGGNVYGAFIDTNRIIKTRTSIPQGTTTYTATEDCAVVFSIISDSNNSSRVLVDGEMVWEQYDSSGIDQIGNTLYVKKGQVLSFIQTYSSSGYYTVYGLTQGTSGIFTPIIYSDTERVVGVWRDNKPLYAKTYHFTSGWVNDSWVDITDLSGLNIDTFVKSDFSVSRINNNLQYTGNGSIRPETSGQNHTVSARYYNNHLQIMVNNYNDIVRLDITIQYTKTTDVAGSGNWNTDGVPTVHYSTSEQVIGTWENGKPLYRRTFTTNTMNIATSADALYSGSVTIGDYIPDVDQIFIDIGKTYVNVSGVTRGLISASQEGSVIAVYSIVSRSNCTITFTVDYTKVTD